MDSSSNSAALLPQESTVQSSFGPVRRWGAMACNLCYVRKQKCSIVDEDIPAGPCYNCTRLNKDCSRFTTEQGAAATDPSGNPAQLVALADTFEQTEEQVLEKTADPVQSDPLIKQGLDSLQEAATQNNELLLKICKERGIGVSNLQPQDVYSAGDYLGPVQPLSQQLNLVQSGASPVPPTFEQQQASHPLSHQEPLGSARHDLSWDSASMEMAGTAFQPRPNEQQYQNPASFGFGPLDPPIISNIGPTPTSSQLLDEEACIAPYDATSEFLVPSTQPWAASAESSGRLLLTSVFVPAQTLTTSMGGSTAIVSSVPADTSTRQREYYEQRQPPPPPWFSDPLADFLADADMGWS